jgi:hypothetical protein
MTIAVAPIMCMYMHAYCIHMQNQMCYLHVFCAIDCTCICWMHVSSACRR